MMADCRIITGQELLEPELQTLPFGKACVFTAKAFNKPGPNEDSLALISVGNEQAVLVIADGLGGHSQGETASRIAVETLCEVVESAGHGSASLREPVLNGVDLANRRILALQSGAATTAVIVEITGRMVRCYQVGDSFALLTGQRGRLKYQSISHSPVGYAVEAGLLTEKEVLQADDRHIVSNVVGSTEMRVDVGPVVKMASRDTLLLASDGLTDNVVVSDIVRQVRKGTLVDSGRALFDCARANMSLPSGTVDDMSTLLFRLSPY